MWHEMYQYGYLFLQGYESYEPSYQFEAAYPEHG